MATKTTKKATVASKTDTKVIDQQNETILLLQKQLEEMRKQMAALATQNAKPTETLAQEAEIPVMNLCVGQLNLSSEGDGQGDITTFDKYGEVIDIPLSELKQLVKNNKRFFKEGMAYILDEAAVKLLRLEQDYKKMINDETLSQILTFKADKVLEIYNMVSEGQKEIIIDMIINKRLNNEAIDANILMELGEKSGKDLLNIENPMKIPVE